MCTFVIFFVKKKYGVCVENLCKNKNTQKICVTQPSLAKKKKRIEKKEDKRERKLGERVEREKSERGRTTFFFVNKKLKLMTFLLYKYNSLFTTIV